MASASPSEFLTFYRRIATSSALRRSVNIQPATRSFASSAISRQSHNFVSDKGTQQDTSTAPKTGANSTHALDKGGDDPNVQSKASAAGRDAKSSGTGGTATEQSDTQNATAKAKKDHPEAPDVVIGMQDERGGKGA